MSGGMEAIQLSAALLRAEAPDLVLRLGSTVAARVVERHGARGLITIGNAVLTAQLPDGVNAGERLRLLVHDATDARVTLKLVREDHSEQTDRSQAFASVPLPSGSTARIVIDKDAGPADSRQPTAVSVTYNSPLLGALQFHITPNAVTVRAAPGFAFDAANAAAGELRDALPRAHVTVVPRDEPVDLYA